MRQSAPQGDNRTGAVAAGARAEKMLEATREFLPSSPGDAQAMAEVRIEYAQAGDGLGETAPPEGLMSKAKAAVETVSGAQPTLLMDKLGERLAFEHAGARLYEAMISKHRAYGSFAMGRARRISCTSSPRSTSTPTCSSGRSSSSAGTPRR